VALENHSIEIPWWNEIAIGLPNPVIQKGYIEVPDGPGLGIEALNDEVIAAHQDPGEPGLWAPTDEWDEDYSNDRLWS
jgi:L-alanine-DL-glutamate epimerase-like enolase superfamily enzyme